MLTDGQESSTGVETTDLPNVYTIGSNASLTYVLGSAANGYGLTQINVYSEWNDGGRSQITLNDIAYSTVANPTVFSAIPDGTINYTSGDAENKASITASGGLLVSGVYALRFDFGSQENGWVGYAELEAVGTPIVGNNPLPATTALTVNATLDLNGGNQQAASLSGSGNIINSYAGTNATLTLNPASGSTTFGGIIQDNGGTGGTVRLALNSSGSGTQILTGLNTYTGGTTVTQGTLQVSSTGGLGPGNLTIASAGTVALQNAAQTVAALSNAGTLSLTGNLTVTGGLTLASGSNTSFALGTPNGTGGTALIAVTGNINNSGSSTNEVSFGWSATPQTGTYDLFSYTGSTTTSTFYLNPASIANYTNLSETLSTGLSGQVDLIVTVLPVAWSGLQGGPNTPWDTATQNWVNSSGTATTYSDPGGVVTFGDTYPTNGIGGTAPVASGNVYIQANGVSPALVTFNNTRRRLHALRFRRHQRDRRRGQYRLERHRHRHLHEPQQFHRRRFGQRRLSQYPKRRRFGFLVRRGGRRWSCFAIAEHDGRHPDDCRHGCSARDQRRRPCSERQRRSAKRQRRQHLRRLDHAGSGTITSTRTRAATA